MNLTAKSRPFGLLMIGAIVALVSACSTSDGATPTLTTPISSSVTSSPSQTVTSTSSQTSASSSFANTSPPQSTATSPWPADLTPDQVAAAQAAIAAYVGYYQAGRSGLRGSRQGLVDRRQRSVATDPEKSSFLRNVAGTARARPVPQRLDRGPPNVTKVEPGVVSMIGVRRCNRHGVLRQGRQFDQGTQTHQDRTFGTCLRCRWQSTRVTNGWSRSSLTTTTPHAENGRRRRAGGADASCHGLGRVRRSTKTASKRSQLP